MIKNFFITGLRNILRDKGFSVINILGFAIGIACTLLILFWVQDELSYDSSHENKDRIYRVLSKVPTGEGMMKAGVTPAALAPMLEEAYPEIEKATRFKNYGDFTFVKGDKRIREEHSGLAEPELFSIFTFPFIEGNPENCLDDPNSIILTEKLAKKYFEKKSALGEQIELLGFGVFKVTGVIENVSHCHFEFNYLIPIEHANTIYNENIDELGAFNYTTYILTAKNTDAKVLNKKIEHFFNEHADQNRQDNETYSMLFLQNLKDIYLRSDFAYDFTYQGDIKNVYIFSAIALIILLIASINFMNLTTARSANRSKEIGVRKVQGARRKHLITQFYIETALITFLSFILALLFVELITPAFNNISGKELTHNLLFDSELIITYVVLAILTALFAGSYPALYLSSFQPVKVLKGKLRSGSKSGKFRKTLVIVQFSISITLIISTIIVNQQLNYINNKKLGYNKENLVGFWKRGEIIKHYDAFKQRLLENPDITNVSAISNPLTYEGPSRPINNWDGNAGERTLRMHYHSVDYDIIETLDIEMLEGRSFTHKFRDDSSSVFLINETAVKKMGIEHPVGKSMTIGEQTGRIVGVFKDFNYNTIHHKINPLTLILDKNACRGVFARIKPGRSEEALNHIKTVWQDIEPNHLFDFHFIDALLESQYSSEKQTAKLFKYFTVLAILISCLGLFGLASFMTEQRQKEIGIRKVMGSKIGQLVLLLTKEFTKWVFIAGIIGVPIGYYAMNKWLQGFHYRIDPGLLVYILALAAALFIAGFTVSLQTYRASIKNPVDTLRDE
jgi:ABC-type antimicrobial peptide transport system permease subunit